MANFKEHIDVWYKYIKADIKETEEGSWVLAGREAEDLLGNIVDDHYQFKGSHSFAGKRVFNEDAGHKNKINLIISGSK